MPDRTFLLMFCLTVVAPFIGGCGGKSGPPRFAAEGTVLLDGAPLPAGVIRFIPEGTNKGPAASATIQNGKFSLDASSGPVAGQHRVEIEATGYEGFAVDDEQAYAQKATTTRGPVIPQNPIPPTYNRQSTLSKTITAEGPNTFEFNLSSKTQTASR
jgi:hypothetical protein